MYSLTAIVKQRGLKLAASAAIAVTPVTAHRVAGQRGLHVHAGLPIRRLRERRFRASNSGPSHRWRRRRDHRRPWVTIQRWGT